jgi:hypothetical protein
MAARSLRRLADIGDRSRPGVGSGGGFRNPVVRSVLEHRLDPIDPADLRAAVATLASAPKDDTRLERFLLDLYRTECSHCGAAVSADYFVWDRELAVPVLKAYVCESCHRSGEEATGPADRERAVASVGYRLANASAAERAAPADDPDREHVEDALAVYPARAIYAMVALLQKLDQIHFPAGQRRAAEALLLSAFDAADGLWGYPESRARPKQLVASPRFREVNVWRALERGQEEWLVERSDVNLAVWPESGPPKPGTLAVFAGPIRELEDTLPAQTPSILTALPRPNQAFWTSGARASGYGSRAAAPIRIALRRRRPTGCSTHGGAAQSTRSPPPEGSTAVVGNRAVSGAAMGPGLPAIARSRRPANDGQSRVAGELRHRAAGGEELQEIMADAAEAALRDLGEPAGYGHLHAAATIALAHRQRLAELWAEDDTPPLTKLTEEMALLLAAGGRFERMEPRMELESGQYWLASPVETAEPLSDRVERLVVETLRARPGTTTLATEVDVCEALRGLQTPDRRLVMACLGPMRSSTQTVRGGFDRKTRPRAESDLREIRGLLEALGGRGSAIGSSSEQITWEEKGRLPLFPGPGHGGFGRRRGRHRRRRVVVLPGGRASLMAEKTSRPAPAALAVEEEDCQVPHVRRLAEEASFHAGNFAERLGIDPAASEDPQLTLL